ncbi:MAG: hypothetical protein ZNDK_1223 [Candidatus Desulfovibrio kirbyi]|jgi:hypothetical protein|uniref:Uncharacterized protein n=1 Tax=Candidatus Desulfovibrio kirbyi TaxID=2696086 RepID=A0A6L2R7J2_9BACT|nr:MAG: hypothetical protein ZNDK_1223 [Candidatus Desulfovibrio kirbyi]
MAEKKAIVILAGKANLAGSGAGLDKLLKKAAVFTMYTAGELVDGAVEAGAVIRLQPDGVMSAVKKGFSLALVDLGDAGTAALDSALNAIIEASDRRTVIAVAVGNALAFYGTGINAKAGKLERAAAAKDIFPTLAYIADFPLTGECTGAILYQALKSPNLKMEELGKLKEAIARMEGALARDSREPWDKHDCA